MYVCGRVVRAGVLTRYLLRFGRRVGLALAVACLGLGSYKAIAALPLLAAAIEYGGPALTSIVVRTAANDALWAATAAANDAAWGSAIASASGTGATWLGLGLLGWSSDIADTKYAVPLVTNGGPKKGAPQEVLQPGVYVPYDDPRVKWVPKSWPSYSRPCSVGPGTFTNSIDGQTHVMGSGPYTADEWIAECRRVLAYEAPNNNGYMQWGTVSFESRAQDQPGYPDTWFAKDVNNQNVFLTKFAFCYQDGLASGVTCMPWDSVMGSVSFAESQDGIKRLARSATGWRADGTDPDWTSEEVEAIQDLTRLTLHVTSGEGQPLRVDLNWEPTQGVFVQAVTQGNENVSHYRDIQFDTSANPLVKSVTERSMPNTLVEYFYEQNPDLIKLDTANSGSGGSVNVQFPDDYARELTVQSISNSASAIRDAVTQTAPLDDPVAPTEVEFKTAWFGESFADILGWDLPEHVAECPVMTLDPSAIGMDAFVIDSHCAIWTEHSGAIGGMMLLAYAVMALFIVLSA